MQQRSNISASDYRDMRALTPPPLLRVQEKYHYISICVFCCDNKNYTMILIIEINDENLIFFY